MNKKLQLIFLILMLIFTTGCWDKIELNDRAFVITLGIDKYNKKKDKNSLKATEELSPQFSASVAIPNPSALSAEGSDQESKTVKTAAASSIHAALKAIDLSLGQRIYFGHTKLVVIGEEMLKDKKLLKEALDSLEREQEFNRKILILAADDTAKEILSAKAPGESLVGLFISKYYKNNNVVSAIKMDLGNLLQQLRSNETAVIPKISLKNKEPVLEGAAILSDNQLVDYLTPKETKGYLWLKGQGSGNTVTADYDKDTITCRITKNKNQITFEELDNKLQCNININCDAIIEEYTTTGSLYSQEVLMRLSTEFSNAMQNEIELALYKIRDELQTDAFDLEKLLKKKNYSLWEKYQNNWDEVYQEKMIIKPKAYINIRNIGSVK